MPSPLDSLAGPGRSLAVEAPDRAEFEGLVRSGRARLADAVNASLSIESRFDLVYNAAHALCLAALRHRGYRSGNRYVVFQVLPHTLGLGPEVWRILDRAHADRNAAEYSGQSHLEPAFVGAMIDACRKVLDAVERLPPIEPVSLSARTAPRTEPT